MRGKQLGDPYLKRLHALRQMLAMRVNQMHWQGCGTRIGHDFDQFAARLSDVWPYTSK